jgi:histidinol-phosphatase
LNKKLLENTLKFSEIRRFFSVANRLNLMPNSLDLDKTLSRAFSYIEKAEKILLKYWPGNMINKEILSFELKSDNSPTTKADSEAEKLLINLIKEDYPDHDIIGEESYKKLESKAEYTWIIDPLDGTKRYLRGHPTFSTQLALAYKGNIILGISNAPMLKEIAWAVRGKGAYFNSKRLQVSKISTLKESYLSFADVKFFIEKKTLNPLLEIINKSSWSRGIGDFMSYHMVAKGDIDAMIEEFTCIWDIAALSVIIEEAGGQVTDLYGNKITLKSDSCIASNGLFHKELVRYFQDEKAKKI